MRGSALVGSVTVMSALPRSATAQVVNSQVVRQTDEERALVEQWILIFCEAPPVIDVELMRRLIAEHQAEPQGAAPGPARRRP